MLWEPTGKLQEAQQPQALNRPHGSELREAKTSEATHVTILPWDLHRAAGRGIWPRETGRDLGTAG